MNKIIEIIELGQRVSLIRREDDFPIISISTEELITEINIIINRNNDLEDKIVEISNNDSENEIKNTKLSYRWCWELTMVIGILHNFITLTWWFFDNFMPMGQKRPLFDIIVSQWNFITSLKIF